LSRFDASFIDDVKRRTALSALIGKSVKLVKAPGLEFKGCCPFHADKRPSFYVNDAKGVYFCRAACAASGDCFTWLMEREGYTFIEAVEELAVRAGMLADANGHKPRKPAPIVATFDPAEAERERGEKILGAQDYWRRIRTPLAGSNAERYFAARDIRPQWLPERMWPPTLRFDPACDWVDCDDDGRVIRRLTRPAVIAAIQAPDRSIIGVHRTYLLPDGSWKAGLINHDGDPADKKMLGVAIGGAVRLGPGGVDLDIAEGLETSLTVMMGTGTPVWAALSLYNMGAIDFPDHVQAVTKWTDSDEGDREAAKKQIAKGNERHAREGLTVRLCPAPEGHDWNSHHMARCRLSRAEAAERAAREVA
jgi:DNA primase